MMPGAIAMDAALIKECSDPSLKPAIVEQFVAAVGSADPFAITVKSGGRLILVPKTTTPEGAMEVVRQHAGKAIVRVGLTQFPAGVGVKDVFELTTDLVEPCKNLRMGTAMFAKILRIVSKWYGNPTNEEVFPQIFEDAIYAWGSGQFEGQSVFQADEPGGNLAVKQVLDNEGDKAEEAGVQAEPAQAPDVSSDGAGIRIDLSRINGK